MQNETNIIDPQLMPIIGFAVLMIAAMIAWQIILKVKTKTFSIARHWIFIIVVIGFAYIGVSLILNPDWLP